MEDVTPAMLRAQAEEALRPVAQRRVRLLEEILACEAELKPLVRRAVEVEISYQRITSLSGESSATIRSWSRPLSPPEGRDTVPLP